MKHIIDDADKNKYEAYTKQEVLEVIQEAISSGELPEELNGLVITLKNPIDNNGYKIAFCTQAKYNELKAGGLLEVNCYYFITDDTTADDLNDAIDGLDSRVDTLEPLSNLLKELTNAVQLGLYNKDLVLWGKKIRIFDEIGDFYLEDELDALDEKIDNKVPLTTGTQDDAIEYTGLYVIRPNNIGYPMESYLISVYTLSSSDTATYNTKYVLSINSTSKTITKYLTLSLDKTTKKLHCQVSESANTGYDTFDINFTWKLLIKY